MGSMAVAPAAHSHRGGRRAAARTWRHRRAVLLDEMLAPSQRLSRRGTKLTAYELPSRAKFGRRFSSSATPCLAASTRKSTPKLRYKTSKHSAAAVTLHSMMPGSPVYSRRRAPSLTTRTKRARDTDCHGTQRPSQQSAACLERAVSASRPAPRRARQVVCRRSALSAATLPAPARCL